MIRVGARVGPFYASTGTSGCAPWILSFIVLVVIVGLSVEHPVAASLIGASLVSMVILGVVRGRERRRTKMARELEALRNITPYVPCPRCGHPTDHQPGCALRRPEVVTPDA